MTARQGRLLTVKLSLICLKYNKIICWYSDILKIHTHLKEFFYSFGFPNGHNNFIRVYMLKSLGCNVISTTQTNKAKHLINI